MNWLVIENFEDCGINFVFNVVFVLHSDFIYEILALPTALHK